MYERILVGVDDSQVSARAFAEAIRLANDQRARLNVVHVVDTRTLYWGADEDPGASRAERSFRARGRHLLDRCRERARAAGVDAETTLLVPEGENVSGAIVEISKRWRADLIVTGTHARRGLRRLLSGSIAESIGRRSAVDVLVVCGREHA